MLIWWSNMIKSNISKLLQSIPPKKKTTFDLHGLPELMALSSHSSFEELKRIWWRASWQPMTGLDLGVLVS